MEHHVHKYEDKLKENERKIKEKLIKDTNKRGNEHAHVHTARSIHRCTANRKSNTNAATFPHTRWPFQRRRDFQHHTNTIYRQDEENWRQLRTRYPCKEILSLNKYNFYYLH